jgi:PhzF family phenazine biosynthesis protein
MQVDVFAPRAGAGNPLAVVFDADDLDLAQMQAIAAWTNLAETTFVLPPSSDDADYRLRIFTTQKEIAFAGHPSIGTAHAVLAAGLARPRDGGLLIQECQAGLLPLRITAADGRPSLAVRVPRSRIVAADGATQALARIVPASVRGALAPTLVEGGRRWWLAELTDEAAVRGFVADRRAILALASDTNSLGLCVFARTTVSGAAGLVVRAFPLGVGIDEDPASGAANAAIAAFLDEAGALGTLGRQYLVSQGREIGRDASLALRIDDQHEVWVGGESQVLIDGELRW